MTNEEYKQLKRGDLVCIVKNEPLVYCGITSFKRDDERKKNYVLYAYDLGLDIYHTISIRNFKKHFNLYKL